MPDNSADGEFDFAQFVQSPMAMLVTVMGAADSAKKTLAAFSESVQSLQRSAAALESILGRIDAVVGQIEAPALVLGPEMERLARRLATMTDVFDRAPIEQIPELFESLSSQMGSVLSGLGGLADIPKRLGPLGDLFGGAAGLFSQNRQQQQAAEPVPTPVLKAVVKKAPTKKQEPAKRPAAKKQVAKRPAVKKTAR